VENDLVQDGEETRTNGIRRNGRNGIPSINQNPEERSKQRAEIIFVQINPLGDPTYMSRKGHFGREYLLFKP